MDASLFYYSDSSLSPLSQWGFTCVKLFSETKKTEETAVRLYWQFYTGTQADQFNESNYCLGFRVSSKRLHVGKHSK